MFQIPNSKFKYIVGIDEVGRGPLAGPVAVAAVIIFSRETLRYLRNIKDSKQLTLKSREEWFEKARALKTQGLLNFSVSFTDERKIDSRGIVWGIHASLTKALKNVCENPLSAHIFLDGGLKAPQEYRFQKTVIRGDESIPVIALASIIAKVERDKKMVRFAQKFPLYGFEQHKGYGTRMHYERIKKHGICPLHRKSFLKGTGFRNILDVRRPVY